MQLIAWSTNVRQIFDVDIEADIMIIIHVSVFREDDVLYVSAGEKFKGKATVFSLNIQIPFNP